MIFLTFKFVHIVAAIVWIGSLVTLCILNLRLAAIADRPVRSALARQSEFLGARVMGPAAGLTLLAGFATDWAGRLGFPLWIVWGIGALVASATFGATSLRRSVEELHDRLANDQSGETVIRAAQRKAAILQGVNIALLLSAAWAMVFKPAL